MLFLLFPAYMWGSCWQMSFPAGPQLLSARNISVAHKFFQSAFKVVFRRLRKLWLLQKFNVEAPLNFNSSSRPFQNRRFHKKGASAWSLLRILFGINDPLVVLGAWERWSILQILFGIDDPLAVLGGWERWLAHGAS